MMDPIERLLGRTVPGRGPVWTPPDPTETEELLRGLDQEILDRGVDLCFGAPVSGIDSFYRRYRGIIAIGLSPEGEAEIRGLIWGWPPAAGLARRMELYRGTDLKRAAEAVNTAINHSIKRGCLPDPGQNPLVDPQEALERLRKLSLDGS